MTPWLQRHASVRLAAVAWWIFMSLFSFIVVGGWISVLLEPSLGVVVGQTITTMLVAPPVWREWSHAGEMSRMLIDSGRSSA
jgi:hypothetical protein